MLRIISGQDPKIIFAYFACRKHKPSPGFIWIPIFKGIQPHSEDGIENDRVVYVCPMLE